MIRIAAYNSLPADQSRADYQCTQSNVTSVLNGILGAGYSGKILAYAGEYTLTKDSAFTPQTCVAIRRNVVIQGEGDDTIFRLADGQRCNMFRTIGGGLTAQLRDLTLDLNAANNQPIGDYDWLEICGFKSKDTTGVANVNCGVERVSMNRAVGLGAYLFGDYSFSRFCKYIGGADHDVAELCSGSHGSLVGNIAEITGGNTGYVFGTDDHNGGLIADNKIVVRAGATVTQAVHRTWGGRYRTIIRGNHVKAEGGTIVRAVQCFGYLNLITGNVFSGTNPYSVRTRIEVNGGTEMDGNIFENIDVAVANTAGWMVHIDNNLLNGCTLPSGPPPILLGDNPSI